MSTQTTRFLVTVEHTAARTLADLTESMYNGVFEYVGGSSVVTALQPGEVIGNLVEFTRAAQEAAQSISVPEVTDSVSLTIHHERMLAALNSRNEVAESLREACDKLFHLAEGLESKKLKKFTNRLHKVYLDIE